MPCTLDEAEDSINFVFNSNGLDTSDIVLRKPKWEKLRFLANCAGLISLDEEYDFSLSLENQLVDINLMPMVLMRDAKGPATESFLQRYKALAGSILLPKYKYEDYLKGGKDLYKKNKLLSELASQETIEEIKERLLKEYKRMMWEVNTTKKLVLKRNVWVSYIAIPLLVFALLATAYLGGRMLFIDIPFRDSMISANIAYINRNPLSVQQILRPYSIENLSEETRYILARSYVSTEALTDIQRENILMTLTTMTNPMLFDYWINLGRLNFAEAVEIAQRLGDDEILLYAYLKQAEFVRVDLSLSGEERIALLAQLERNIDTLNQARDQAANMVFGNLP